MSIDFYGLNEVLDMLDKPVEPQTVDKALNKACLVVERSARQKAQEIKDTGALSRSIKHEVKNHEGIIYTPLEYAPYVEYGTGLFAENGGRTDVPWNYKDDEGEWHSTSGQKPQPFMRPALDENREEILRVLKEGILSND